MLLLYSQGEFVSQLPADIDVIRKDHSRIIASVFTIFSTIWRRRPDVVFSTLGPLNILIALMRPLLPRRTKFIGRESSILSSRNRDEKFPKIFDFLYKHFYNNLDTIICQSEYMQQDLVRHFRVKKSKSRVVYNPVETDPSPVQERPTGSTINLIAIGRLAPEKGYDRLIEVMSLLDPKQFTLKILGSGPLEKDIKTQIEKHNLSGSVQLLGFVDNPREHIREAHCLIVGSRYEGFPNVVLEANACGVPVIAFNCPGGISEVIKEGFNGWLVKDNDIAEFAERIRSRPFLSTNGTGIRQLMEDSYSMKKIIREYETIILETSKAI